MSTAGVDAYSVIAELLHKSQVSSPIYFLHLRSGRCGSGKIEGGPQWEDQVLYDLSAEMEHQQYSLLLPACPASGGGCVCDGLFPSADTPHHNFPSHFLSPSEVIQDSSYIVMHSHTHILHTSQIVDLLTKKFLYIDERRFDLLQTEIFAAVSTM